MGEKVEKKKYTVSERVKEARRESSRARWGEKREYAAARYRLFQSTVDAVNAKKLPGETFVSAINRLVNLSESTQ